MKRKATAVWKGGKRGTGQLTTETKVLNNTSYSFKSRFEDGKETNPEELIAGAHAGCFAMKLGIVLEAAGFPPDELAVEGIVTVEDGVINNSHLVLKARVPKITKEKFDACATEAKNDCPVSKALGIKVTLDAALV